MSKRLIGIAKNYYEKCITINLLGSEVPVYGDSLVVDDVVETSLFKNWKENLEVTHRTSKEKFVLEKIEVQSVDRFSSGRIGFIKFKSYFYHVQHNGMKVKIPGIVFMRGGSVGILVILEAIEDGEEFCLLTRQPRIGIGDFEFLEIPAGMVDSQNKVRSKAIEEIEEETGLKINKEELLDLTKKEKIFLTPGGSDEWMRIFCAKVRMKKSEILDLREKRTGLRGEIIHLEVVPKKEIFLFLRDAKSMLSIFLYDQMKKESDDL